MPTDPHRVPAAVRPPLDVELARAVENIAQTAHLPGSTLWEPKWDGYRLLIVRDGPSTTLWSRRGTDLSSAFPDIGEVATDQVPAGTVLDGEVVVWAGGRLDFSALQRRVAGGRQQAARLAREQPANYVAFDVLAHAGHDLRDEPLSVRRALLEELAAAWQPPMTLSPATTDIDVAQGWFTDLAPAGLEGLVAKGLATAYRGGRREWLKVKHRSVLDVICAAVIGPATRPTVVVAGLPLEGELRIVGRTVPLSATASRNLGSQIVPATGEHPWPRVVASGTVNGFGASRDPVTLTRIEPVVVEVSADVAWSGRSFRHPLRFVRSRLDVDPADVDLDPMLLRE